MVDCLFDGRPEQLQNLLRRLLEKDAEHRIELSAAIRHPWVTVEGSMIQDDLEAQDESSGNDLDVEVGSFGEACGHFFRAKAVVCFGGGGSGRGVFCCPENDYSTVVALCIGSNSIRYVDWPILFSTLVYFLDAGKNRTNT